jgi:hypothetical protein
MENMWQGRGGLELSIDLGLLISSLGLTIIIGWSGNRPRGVHNIYNLINYLFCLLFVISLGYLGEGKLIN